MNSALARRILNFILVAAMLISGMCYEHVEADSLFVVHAVNEKDTIILTSAKDIPAQQTICTNEITGVLRIECNEVQSGENSRKTAVRTGEALIGTESLFAAPLLCKSVITEKADKCPSGREVIIAYIHHQDGAKGIL